MSFQLCQRWKYHLNKHGQPPMNYKIHLLVVIKKELGGTSVTREDINFNS